MKLVKKICAICLLVSFTLIVISSPVYAGVCENALSSCRSGCDKPGNPPSCASDCDTAYKQCKKGEGTEVPIEEIAN